MRVRSLGLVSIFALAIGASACAGQTIYYWGGYEDSLAALVTDEVPAHVEERIHELETIVAEADARGKPPPPGIFAHLGYLYAETGGLATARRYFELERSAWPESAPFMDRLIERTR